ncbi:UNVERIFIED_CONTAM: hypothetical protein GTU68_022273 [Idotea baltica]|nr:hypothetical protein [Idotea baltica]
MLFSLYLALKVLAENYLILLGLTNI